MAKRHIMRIELDGPAMNKLKTLSDSHGMTQVSFMSRLVETASRLDASTRALLIGAIPSESIKDVAKSVLAKMA